MAATPMPQQHAAAAPPQAQQPPRPARPAYAVMSAAPQLRIPPGHSTTAAATPPTDAATADDGDAPPGLELPATTAAPADPQKKKLPKALLARLKQRGVVKEDDGGDSGADAGVHPATGHTSASVMPTTATTVDAQGPLPAGWKMAVDPRYNHPYWFNAATGERRWIRPHDPAAAAPGDLPEGWQAAVDHATGFTYYYNRRLDTQQWERPAGAPAAAAVPEFEACTAFDGARTGRVFTTGPRGLGYYRCDPHDHAFTDGTLTCAAAAVIVLRWAKRLVAPVGARTGSHRRVLPVLQRTRIAASCHSGHLAPAELSAIASHACVCAAGGAVRQVSGKRALQRHACGWWSWSGGQGP